MKHTEKVSNFVGNNRQLAEEMGNLYYDSLAELLWKLGEKLERDAASDHRRGRMKLTAELAAAADHLYAAAENIASAWLICKPYVAETDQSDGGNYDRQLLLARVLAEKAHADQTDKSGTPYINHPYAVMRMAEPGIDRIVAILHDVVEDSDTSIEKIRSLFGNEVAAAVDAVTRRPGEDPAEYYGRVRNNEVALRVKHLDLRHNSDPERLAQLPPEMRTRLEEKYAKARQHLQGI
ncbi:MAG: HD domain-containing protein [Desulfuromonadaceae bacterium]